MCSLFQQRLQNTTDTLLNLTGVNVTDFLLKTYENQGKTRYCVCVCVCVCVCLHIFKIFPFRWILNANKWCSNHLYMIKKYPEHETMHSNQMSLHLKEKRGLHKTDISIGMASVTSGITSVSNRIFRTRKQQWLQRRKRWPSTQWQPTLVKSRSLFKRVLTPSLEI